MSQYHNRSVHGITKNSRSVHGIARNSLHNKEQLHCQWCFNAKQPESVVKSHNVKNKAGVVVCQLLLNHKCSACNGYGHTRTNCSVSRDMEKERKHDAYLKRKREYAARESETRRPEMPVNKNLFAALDSDTESETDTEFPALKSTNVTTRPAKKLDTWYCGDSDSDED